MWAVMIFHLCLQAVRAWDADAGLMPSFLDPNTTTIISNSGFWYMLPNTIDGDSRTFWMSHGCLPINYFSNPHTNVLTDACKSPGSCPSTNLNDSSTIDLNWLVDGWTYTDLKMHAAPDATGPVTIDIPVPNPQRLQFVNIYAYYGNGTDIAYLRLYNEADILVHEWQFTAEDKFKYMPMEVPVNDTIAKIGLQFDEICWVWEISAIGENGCQEEMIWDMGGERELGGIKSQHHAIGEGLEYQVWLSEDNTTWVYAVDLSPEANGTVTANFPTPITARFIKMVYRHSFQHFANLRIHEMSVFGPGGEYGVLPAPAPNPATLREMFGVNGAWGWSTGQQSPDLGEGEGASRYNSIASHARNLHFMHWDISDPDNVADYDTMAAGGGTETQFWLNWDTEYAEWVNANLTLDASIVFAFSPSEWDTPGISAHSYGQNFAEHFGTRDGTGVVTAAEVGNEPLEYNATFYNELLKFMAKGLKDGDGNMIVLPAAFQANNDKAIDSYIGATVSEDATPYLDALNFHQSSFIARLNGLRVATYPENSASDFNAIRNMIRWRNANMPGKPIWITQWGWDSPGAGQKCLFPECVSETAAATYATRGLLIHARLGIERSYWYDHANHDCDDHLWCRSGLTGDDQVNFEKKEAYIGLQGLLDVMGDVRFLDVIQEDDQAYVYAFGYTEDGTVNKMMTHIVAWRPIDVDNNHDTVTVSVSVDATPVETFCQDDTGFPTCPGRQPSASSGGTMSLDISPRPMIVEVQETILGLLD